jgi:hypothetical protein
LHATSLQVNVPTLQRPCNLLVQKTHYNKLKIT